MIEAFNFRLANASFNYFSFCSLHIVILGGVLSFKI